MYSIKLTKYFSNNSSLVSSSVQIVNGYDKITKKNIGNKIIKTFHYGENNIDLIEDVKIIEISNYKEIMEELSKLNLQNLANNYYDNASSISSGHWELEYDMFKIVGTYDSYLDVLKEIEEIIEFD